MFMLLLSCNLCARDFGVRGPMQFEFYGEPGEVLTGSIKLHNPDKNPKGVKVRCFDFPLEIHTDMNNPIVGEDPHSCAAWVELSKSEVMISSRSDYSYNYNISIPNDPNLEGSYNCIILLSPSSKSADSSENKKMISYVIQYAAQAIVHIKGTGQYALSAEDRSVTYNKAIKELQYHINIKNEGSLALRPRVSVDIYNSQGIKVLHENPYERWTFPSQKNKYTIGVSDLPVGKYRGVMVFDQKGSKYFAAKLNFEITYSDNLKRIKPCANNYLNPEDRMRSSLQMPSMHELLETRSHEVIEDKKENQKEGNFFKIFEESISKLFHLNKSRTAN